MGIVITIFVLLFIVFLIGSGLIIRHALKFGYLAPNFRIVTIIYAALSLVVIIFGIYLLMQINSEPSPVPYESNYSSGSGELNF